MNFTREPIIETIITPKDGYKLVVRNSKGGNQEEYHVDAVEVVSFGHSFFFRSMERPKSFLVPVSDYEIVELKETRVVLKNVNIERSIKIGGGRQPQQQPQPQFKETQEEVVAVEEVSSEASLEANTATVSSMIPKSERKRDRRRNRRSRRGQTQEERHQDGVSKETVQIIAEPPAQGGGQNDEAQVSSSMFSSLFPPPPTLISETIGRYKEKNIDSTEGDLLSHPIEEKKKRKKEEKELSEESSEAAKESHAPTASEEDDYFMI